MDITKKSLLYTDSFYSSRTKRKWNSKYAKFICISSITILLTIVCLYQGICYNDSSKFVVNNHHNQQQQQSSSIWGNFKSFSSSDESLEEVAGKETIQFDYQDVNRFVAQVFDLMLEFRPREITGKVHDSECTLETLRIDPDYEGPIYSKEYLSKCMIINYNVYYDLKFKHAQFLANLPLEFPDGLYEGRGIVMVGGGRYSLLGYLVIRILRERGTTLPIEVFMPPGSNDELYCNEILPKYNAKCISLRKFFDDEAIQLFLFRGFQFKSLLFLTSSFEELLYIDSDNYPLFDVEPIFENEPFTSHGLILWPDFWRRATAPLYYDIAGLKIGKQVRFGVDTVTKIDSWQGLGLDLDTEVSLHDREGTIPDGTSESSSIFLNKKTHLKTMLLSMYYNLYGTLNYYALLSQDTFGEGDKETFAAAAVLTNEPFWQVKTRAQPGGALLHIGKRPRSTTMLQYNPIVDYETYKELCETLNDIKDNTYDKMRVPNYYNTHNKNISFVHYNLGKLDPLTMSGWNRRYGYDLTDIGFDFELHNVELMVEMFCSEVGKVPLEYVGFEDEKVQHLCQESRSLFERMNSTSEKVILDKLDLDKLEPFSNI